MQKYANAELDKTKLNLKNRTFKTHLKTTPFTKSSNP